MSTMYELRKNKQNLIDKFDGTDSRNENKLQKGVNLLESQWKLLDELAEKRNKSRNQVLRDILKEYSEGGL